jgi:hypothetical protein
LLPKGNSPMKPCSEEKIWKSVSEFWLSAEQTQPPQRGRTGQLAVGAVHHRGAFVDRPF